MQGVNNMKCIVCNRKQELRYKICWDCANAESIIGEGVDNYGKGLFSDNVNSFDGAKGREAVTLLEKIMLLIQKGWQPPK